MLSPQLKLLWQQIHPDDRRPLRLSRAEKDLLRRMPRPADPAFDIRVDFHKLVAIDPNDDLDEGGCA